MRVDLVDRGAFDRPGDPIRPLAAALQGAGHTVRLLSSDPPAPADLPGVELLRIRRSPGSTGRPTSPRVASSLFDPASAGVIAPYELVGASGFAVPGPGTPILSVLPTADAPRAGRGTGLGWVGRYLAQRTARKEAQQSLTRSRWILAPGQAERDAFVATAASAAGRTAVVVAPVPGPPASPDRSGARRLLHIPDDVPVAAFYDGGADEAATLVRETFRRARVFFPGARLVVVGRAVPPEPGVVAYPIPDPETRNALAAAADVLLAPPGGSGEWTLRAMRAGVAPIIGGPVRLPIPEPSGASRRAESEDAGAYASALAELFADIGLRRKIGEKARAYADEFAPERVVAQILPMLGAPR